MIVAVEATALSLLIAYPIAYFLARKAQPTPRAWCWCCSPSRSSSITSSATSPGPVCSAATARSTMLLSALGLIEAPLDWLLYSDFAVFVGLISSYMPFMIFPLVLSIGAIDKQYLEASALLGARPATTFLRITLPLSLPGIFAALIFGFVGCFGESAVPIIMGGVGYELVGNTITSSMDVLNYPLAAALSSIVVVIMLLLMLSWYLVFDMRAFLGKVLEWRGS